MHLLKNIMNYYKSLNIFTKLISLIIVVIMIPVFIGYYLSINSMQKLVTKQIINDSNNSLQFIKHDIEELFTRTASTILYISDEEIVIELFKLQDKKLDKEERGNYIKGIRYLEKVIPNITYGRLPFRARISLIAPTGILYTTSGQEEVSNQLDFNEYLDEIKMDEKGVASEYIRWKSVEVSERESDYGEWNIAALKAVNDDNKTIGIIKIGFSEAVLQDIISKGSDGFVRYLLDENQNIISSSDREKDFSSIPFYVNGFKSKEEGNFISDDIKGEKEIITFKKIYNTKWTLVEIRPYSQILNVYSSTAYIQLFFTINTTLIFIILSIFVIRTITKPIKRLSKVMLQQDLYQYENSEQGVVSNEIRVLENSYSTMLNNMKQLMDKNIDIEKKKRNAELKALQSQIKPHFLFNTLSVIRFSILNNKSDKAEKMIIALIKLLDATIFRNEDLINLSDEIENTKNYVEIIKLRQGVELTLSITIEEELLSYKVPRLILQPIVENSIIHGLEVQKSGCISIASYRTNHNTIVSVGDNGCGFDATQDLQGEKGDINKKIKFSGIGIKNIDERIKIQYGDNYGVTVKSKVNVGTTVNIMLPY